MNKGKLLDGKDNARFILILIVVKLLGSFLCRDESYKTKENCAPMRWSAGLKTPVLAWIAIL